MFRFLNSMKLAAILPAATLAYAIAATPIHAEEKSMNRMVTVSASGTATATPDEASIATGVSSEAETAREALTKNTAAMGKVIAELKAAGIEAKDIQTTQFNVEPVHAYSRDGNTPPKVTGYRVSNMVSVRVRNLDNLGAVLDQLVSAGANQINSIAFNVSKEETLKDEARKEAMANAKRRAGLLAEAAGAEIGKVLQISEEISEIGPRPVVFAKRAMAAEAAPIERGEQQLMSRVTVTWKLK